jgi:hypothetical protein
MTLRKKHIALIVVAMLLIGFAAIFMDAAATRTARIRFALTMVETTTVQQAAADYFSIHRKMPADLAVIDMPATVSEEHSDAADAPATFSYRRTMADGTLTITYNDDAGALVGKTIVVAPETSGAKVVWNCRGGTVPGKYRLPNCRQ